MIVTVTFGQFVGTIAVVWAATVIYRLIKY